MVAVSLCTVRWLEERAHSRWVILDEFKDEEAQCRAGYNIDEMMLMREDH